MHWMRAIWIFFAVETKQSQIANSYKLSINIILHINVVEYFSNARVKLFRKEIIVLRNFTLKNQFEFLK